MIYFPVFLVFILIVAVLIFKYMNGDFNYRDTVFHTDLERGIVIIRRDWDNGHVDFITKYIKE